MHGVLNVPNPNPYTPAAAAADWYVDVSPGQTVRQHPKDNKTPTDAAITKTHHDPLRKLQPVHYGIAVSARHFGPAPTRTSAPMTTHMLRDACNRGWAKEGLFARLLPVYN
jgi:hypothetical protein